MNEAVEYRVSGTPETDALCSLRESAGWDRAESDYPAALAGYDTTVEAYSKEGRLVGWCAIVSDGVRHAFLLDVIVDPNWQRQGIGRALIQRGCDAVHDKGITIIHADFTQENKGFYEACGFRIGSAGIYEYSD